MEGEKSRFLFFSRRGYGAYVEVEKSRFILALCLNSTCYIRFHVVNKILLPHFSKTKHMLVLRDVIQQKRIEDRMPSNGKSHKGGSGSDHAFFYIGWIVKFLPLHSPSLTIVDSIQCCTIVNTIDDFHQLIVKNY